MRAFVLAPALALVLAFPAFADAPEPDDPPDQQLAEICVDLHPAPGCETLILTRNWVETDTADLDIRSGGAILLNVPGIAFAGIMAGTLPVFETDGDTLRLVSGNGAVGRNLWQLSLRLGWDGERFTVQALDYRGVDRLGPASISCSLDFGAGTMRLETMRAAGPDGEDLEETARTDPIPAEPLPLSGFQAFDRLPAPCDGEVMAFFDRLP